MTRETFGQMYAMYYKDFYRFAMYILRNPEEAEDAVGDAIESAWKYRKTLRQDSAFKSWMIHIVLNQCNQIMAKRKDATVELEDYHMISNVDYADNQALWEAFGTLDCSGRKVLALSIFAGYTSKEIGITLGMTEGGVRSLKSRSLQRLRSELEGGAL